MLFCGGTTSGRKPEYGFVPTPCWNSAILKQKIELLIIAAILPPDDLLSVGGHQHQPTSDWQSSFAVWQPPPIPSHHHLQSPTFIQRRNSKNEPSDNILAINYYLCSANCSTLKPQSRSRKCVASRANSNPKQIKESEIFYTLQTQAFHVIKEL